MKDELKQMKEVELKDHLTFQGKVVALHEYDVKLPNGNTAKREVVRHTKGATILAINDKNECLLEHQFRFAYQEVVLELPAGKCEEGEDPLVAAKRELEEETGYKTGKIVKLGEFYPSCGYTDENIYLFLATDLSLGERHLDADENLHVEWVKLDDVIAMIKENKIKDGKTIATIFDYLLHHTTQKELM